MKNSEAELAIGTLCFDITVTQEWKNAYMKIYVFNFFSCTMILLCLVNWSCCKCPDTLCLSFGKQSPEFLCPKDDLSSYLCADVFPAVAPRAELLTKLALTSRLTK